MTCARYLLFASLLSFACSGGGASKADGGGGGGNADANRSDGGAAQGCGKTAGTESRFDVGVGTFLMRSADWGATFSGGVLASVPNPWHQEAERDGQCRLLRYEASFCTPACEFGQACIEGTCRQYPSSVSVGALTLTGATTSPVVLQPGQGARYDWFTEDPVAEGTDIEISAEGATGPVFSLATCTVSAPTPAADWDALLEARQDGADVTLSWSNPEPSARFYLRMTTGIGTHGGISPVEIECEGRDTGSLTLSGSYLDALYDDGWSCGECGTNTLHRYYFDEETTSAGVVQLQTRSSVDFYHLPGR